MLRAMLILMCLGFVALPGCQSGQEREAEAKAEIEEQKLEARKKYTECIEEHGGAEGAKEKCAHFKEIVETLK